MSNERSEFIKSYFFEPIGWMFAFATFLVLTLSRLEIITLGNLINLRYLIFVAVGLFTYSLSRVVLRLSIKWQRRVFFFSSTLLGFVILFLSYIYVKNFQESQYSDYGKLIAFERLNLTSLLIAYITGFISVSLSVVLNKIDDDRERKIENFKKETFLSNFVKYSISLMAVFFIGIGLRIKELYNLGFWIDESISVLVAKQIIDGKGQTLLSGEFYDRAMVYHHYLASFMESFSFLGINTSTRLVNLPFYIISFFCIFFLGKYIANRRVGLIAATLFSFSWVSISMFRDARFYEMLAATFVPLCFVIIYFYNLLSESNILEEKLSKAWKASGPYQLRIFVSTILILGLGWLAFDTQAFVALIVYPLFLFGFLLMIFKKDKYAPHFTVIFLFMVIGGAVFAYGENFTWSNIFIAPAPDWKNLYGSYPYNEFWKFLLKKQFGYLAVILTLSIPLLVHVWKKKAVFPIAMAVGWYSIIALQGYNTDIVRYYYPALPFILLTTGLVFDTYIRQLKRVIFTKFAFTLFLLTIVGMTLYGGWIESNSTIERNSLNRIKNSTFDGMTNYIISTGAVGKATMVTDHLYALNYYLAIGRSPDYMVLNERIAEYDPNRIDIYTSTPQINYTELANLPRPIYVAMDYGVVRIGEEFIPFVLNNGGVQVYKDGAKTVYYFPIATTTVATSTVDSN